MSDLKQSAKLKGVIKGRSSGLVISLIVHAVAFPLAGVLIVFEVFEKEESEFAPPPPAERPKMRLQKPKVKVKSDSKPKYTAKLCRKPKWLCPNCRHTPFSFGSSSV